MPGPGFPVANKILFKYEQDRAYRLHRQKVRVGWGWAPVWWWKEVIAFFQVTFIHPLVCVFCYVGKLCSLLKTEQNVINAKKIVL